jgi:hypothetical protein
VGLKKAVAAADIPHMPLQELRGLEFTADVRLRKENALGKVAGP